MQRNLFLIKLQTKVTYKVTKNELLYSYSSRIISRATENLSYLGGYFQVDSLSLSSEIPFSKSFSHIKTSQSWSWVRNSVLMTMRQLIYISVQLAIKLNSRLFNSDYT